MKPSLKAITVEKYQDIPAAQMIFPKAGAYELELSGAPKAKAEFKPFLVKHTVTVEAGTSHNQMQSLRWSWLAATQNQQEIDSHSNVE